MGSLPKDYFLKTLQYTRKYFQDIYPAIDPSSPANSLAGKIAVVTGASRGIGARVRNQQVSHLNGLLYSHDIILRNCPSLARAGPHGLVLVARDEAKLKEIETQVHRINPKIETLLVALDITDEAAVKQLYTNIRERFGRHAEILVANAAVSAATNGGGPVLHEAPVDKWWSNFEINVKGFFILSKYFISSLPTPTTPATIINISTSGAWLVFPSTAPYSVSKLASQQWCTFLDAAYKGTLTVVSIHPGLVETDMNADFTDFDLDSPALTGGLCAWVAADRARSEFLSGRVICANWDVEELVARKSDIVAKNELTMKLAGSFGSEQFSTA